MKKTKISKIGMKQQEDFFNHRSRKKHEIKKSVRYEVLHQLYNSENG